MLCFEKNGVKKVNQNQKVCAVISTKKDDENITTNTVINAIPDRNTARVILTRLAKEGILKKVSKGTWQIADRNKLIERIQSKHNKHNKRVLPGVLSSTGTKPLFVMPHKIEYIIHLREEIQADLSLLGWEHKKINKGSEKYIKRIYLNNGVGAKAMYNKGKHKHSINIYVDRVMIRGNLIQEHLDHCYNGAKEIVREMSEQIGAQTSLIEIQNAGEFAFTVPVSLTNDLKGKATLDKITWLDFSLGEQFPEIETFVKAQAERIAELPVKLEELQSDTTERINDLKREMAHNRQGNVEIMNFLGDIAEMIMSNNELLKAFIDTAMARGEYTESIGHEKEEGESTGMRYIG